MYISLTPKLSISFIIVEIIQFISLLFRFDLNGLIIRPYLIKSQDFLNIVARFVPARNKKSDYEYYNTHNHFRFSIFKQLDEDNLCIFRHIDKFSSGNNVFNTINKVIFAQIHQIN